MTVVPVKGALGEMLKHALYQPGCGKRKQVFYLLVSSPLRSKQFSSRDVACSLQACGCAGAFATLYGIAMMNVQVITRLGISPSVIPARPSAGLGPAGLLNKDPRTPRLLPQKDPQENGRPALNNETQLISTIKAKLNITLCNFTML